MQPMFKAILAQVRRVPRGKVATYGDVAYAAGFPGAARQVAWALHTSSQGLPWHRIVGAGGRILLGAEAGFEQRMRLQAEGVRFIGLRIDMAAHHFKFFSHREGSAAKTKRVANNPRSAPNRKSRIANRRELTPSASPTNHAGARCPAIVRRHPPPAGK
ncbi:MAG: MGMT family protein [Terriglobales bacterium]